MKQNSNKRHLESFKVFPYVAWGLIFTFTFFVYSIAQNLRTVLAQVSAQSVFLEQTVNTQIDEVSNFEN